MQANSFLLVTQLLPVPSPSSCEDGFCRWWEVISGGFVLCFFLVVSSLESGVVIRGHLCFVLFVLFEKTFIPFLLFFLVFFLHLLLRISVMLTSRN